LKDNPNRQRFDRNSQFLVLATASEMRLCPGLLCFSICTPVSIALISPTACAQSKSQTESMSKQPAENEPAVNQRVTKLFAQMREGTYRDVNFPELTWQDVPSLMKLAESDRILSNVPTNLLSSQSPLPTQEGVVAMWLIEGIRKGGKHPSLNCMLLDRKPGQSQLPHNHESLHLIALRYYQKWWSQIDPKPVEENAELQPLPADCEIGWY